MPRLILALVAMIAFASGQAYASGGPGVDHDDTTYSDTASTWGGVVTSEVLTVVTYDDTRYPAVHSTIEKDLLRKEVAVSLANGHDTIYPAAEPQERLASADE